jgi:PII-like signaling protein
MTPLFPHRHTDDLPAREPREDLSGSAMRLTVHLADGELHHHSPVYAEIVLHAHRAGLAGTSVIRGMEGFGPNSRTVHTARMLDLADNLPLLVIIVDTPDRIRAFLPTLREISPHSLATLEPVELVPARQSAESDS